MPEQRAALTEEERKTADRLRELALYGIAGEFSVPLNLIALNREYLQMHLERSGGEYSREKTAQALRDIDSATRLLSRLTENFTELCACLCGAVTPSADAVDLYALLRSLCADSGRIYQAIGVRLVLECGPEQECCVLADQILTERILLHLLSNGLRACQPGGCVSFALKRQKDTVCLQVRDDGCVSHFPPAAEDVMQENGACGGEGCFWEGGLGLYLCGEYSRLMGWQMEIRPAQPGTLISLQIPVQAAELEGRVRFHSCGQRSYADRQRFRAALLQELRCVPGLEEIS